MNEDYTGAETVATQSPYAGNLDLNAEAGYDTFEDSNGFKQDGFGTFDVTIDNGQRQGVSRAYLDEINGQKNLSIEHNTDVSKIIFIIFQCFGCMSPTLTRQDLRPQNFLEAELLHDQSSML